MTTLSGHEQAHTPRVAMAMHCMQAPQREKPRHGQGQVGVRRCISEELVSVQGLAEFREVQRGMGAHKVGLLPRAM